jgi:23S rRNA (cytidine1920-2'-O)/16S rRNA (cytidine1409-2'-O)-methyltransferase
MARPDKRRADQLLVDQGQAESRTRAQALILAGVVFLGERRIEKPGELVAASAVLQVRRRDHPWVSRGGVKLAAALDRFAINPAGCVCLDVGASTGGFTHVLLTRGAARVYAVDVGHGQLAWELRQDPRVIVHERVNARQLTPALIGEPVGLIVCDVSFISLTLALAAPLTFAAPAARLVALVKPQFEAGRAEVGKGGIVRDPEVRAAACARVEAWLASQGWSVQGRMPSPITGADGNVEFLVAAQAPEVSPK